MTELSGKKVVSKAFLFESSGWIIRRARFWSFEFQRRILTYIYIYIERERERDIRDKNNENLRMAKVANAF